MQASQFDANSYSTRLQQLASRHQKSNFSLALEDFFTGLMSFHVWSTLAWQQIRMRYRRSKLGPLWLTLSTGIMVLTMGPVYSKLFGQPVGEYFVYLSVSLVVWTLISQTILESTAVFIGAEGFIKSVKLPLTIHLFIIMWRALITFTHNLIVIGLVFLFFPPQFSLSMLLFFPALLLIMMNLVWAGVVLGLICARFRDVPQIVQSFIGIAFMLTPIIWQPGLLGKTAIFVQYNPFYHAIEIIRRPLLGTYPSATSWIAMLIVAFVGYSIMFFLFSRYRARIAYWI